MDHSEWKKAVCERTTEHLLKKIEHILIEREEEGGHLTHDEVQCIKDAWKAIMYAKQA